VRAGDVGRSGLEIFQIVQSPGANRTDDPGRLRAHQTQHSIRLGAVTKRNIEAAPVPLKPGQVALDRRGADEQPIMVGGDTDSGQIAFNAAVGIQHRRVNRSTGLAVHLIGANPVQKAAGIGTAHFDLAECGLVKESRPKMRLLHFTANLIEPVGFAEGQPRLAALAEIKRPLETVDLPEMGLGLTPPVVTRHCAQFARRTPLSARKGDLVMFAEHFGNPCAQCPNGVETFGEAFRIGFMKIERQMAVDNAARQRHARSAAGCDANGIHPAPKIQTSRFSRFAEQKRSVGGETFRSIEQHAHFSGLQRRQTMQCIQHHRFKMIPILREQLEGEILTNSLRIDGTCLRLETTDQQSTGIVANVKMAVVIGECRYVADNAFNRLGQKVIMFTGPHRKINVGHRCRLAAPQAGAQGNRVASHQASGRFNAGYFAGFCSNSGYAGVLVNPGTARFGAFNKCCTKI